MGGVEGWIRKGQGGQGAFGGRKGAVGRKGLAFISFPKSSTVRVDSPISRVPNNLRSLKLETLRSLDSDSEKSRVLNS